LEKQAGTAPGSSHSDPVRRKKRTPVNLRFPAFDRQLPVLPFISLLGTGALMRHRPADVSAAGWQPCLTGIGGDCYRSSYLHLRVSPGSAPGLS
jgi:hypothetical protein